MIMATTFKTKDSFVKYILDRGNYHVDRPPIRMSKNGFIIRSLNLIDNATGKCVLVMHELGNQRYWQLQVDLNYFDNNKSTYRD